MDQQKAMMHALWRKAIRQEVPVRIPCGTAAKASKMRFALYNSVRNVRSGKEQSDAALLDALENCSVFFEEKDKSVLVIGRKVASEMMQTIAGILGEEKGLLKSSEEIKMEELWRSAMGKVAEKVAEGAAEGVKGKSVDIGLPSAVPRATPYYTR